MARYTRHELALGRREAKRRGLVVPKGTNVVETSSGRLIFVDKTGKAFPQKIADSLNRAARNRKDADVQDEARWIEYQQTGVPLTPADIRQIDSARGRRGIRGIIDAINSGGVRPDQQREYIQAARRLAGLGATAYREPVVHIDRRNTWKWQPLARPKPRVIRDAWIPDDAEAWEIATKEQWSRALQESLSRWMGVLGLRSPLPQSPARLAARLFQGFLRRPIAYVPWELAVLASNVVDPYYIDQPRYDDYPLHLERTVVSDKNCAYGAILRTLPDLSHWRGRWRRVTGYAGPWGIYQTESGPQAGCMIEPRGHTVEWGWVWDEAPLQLHRRNRRNEMRAVRVSTGEMGQRCFHPIQRSLTQGSNFLSPMRRFVDWCYAAHGPFPKLMRRLPVYFVGKCAEAEEPDHGVMRAGGHYYPPIWVWVTQQLKLEMARITKSSGAFMAYIDAIHTRGPLDAVCDRHSDNGGHRVLGGGVVGVLANSDAICSPHSNISYLSDRRNMASVPVAVHNSNGSELYGASIGSWKIQHDGPAVYYGLNHYAVDCRVHGRICYLHQGIEVEK